MTVFQSYCTMSIYLDFPLRAYSGPYLQLAGPILNSYQFFTQRAFWKEWTVSFMTEIQDSSFVQTRIKYSLLLEKHCSAKLLATATYTTLVLTGEFPRKISLQKPSLTLSLAATHLWSSFQVSIYMFNLKNIWLQVKKKKKLYYQKAKPGITTKTPSSLKLCLILNIDTFDALM